MRPTRRSIACSSVRFRSKSKLLILAFNARLETPRLSRRFFLRALECRHEIPQHQRVARMTAHEGLPAPRRYFAIVAISCATAVAVIDSAIVSVALPTLARDLQVPASSAVLVVTIYQLVLVMSLLPFSAIGDRIGHRRLLQYGLSALLASTLLCFFARSLPFLMVARALQALGGAAALSVNSALIRAIYPGNQLGRGLGVNGVVVSMCGALAPLVGGAILGFASWPWLFAVAAPFALLALVLSRSALPAPEPHSAPYDVLGALLCALSFGLTVAGIESAVHGDSPVIAAAIFVAGIIIGTVFVKRELHEAFPILPVDLLRHRIVALSSTGALLAFIASMIVIVSLPFRLQQQYGFTPGQVGLVIAPWALGMMFTAPLAGALTDRYPAWIVGSIGMAIATVALLLLAYLPADVTQASVAWRMALFGPGFGLFLGSNSRVIVGAAPRSRAASAGGLLATTRLSGQALGATVAAALLAAKLGNNGAPALVAAALTFLAGVCSLSRAAAPPAIAR
jgi:MFS transporter, DHA2 family, multidrug resistance protein